MGERIFPNWNRSEVSIPRSVAVPRDVDELVEVVTDRERYPSPVRAVGNRHSLNACFTTTGTHVDMSNFDTVSVDAEARTISVGASVTMLGVRDALQPHGMQVEVAPEIGTATAGSLACCGTKDASIGPTGLGQVSSTVVGVRVVNPRGEVEAITEDSDADRLRELRSSYGLLGIVFEATFRIQPEITLGYKYGFLRLDPLPTVNEVFDGADGVLGFLQPFARRILAERRYVLEGRPRVGALSRLKRSLRDKLWESGASFLATVLPFNRGYGALDDATALALRGLNSFGGFRARRSDSMLRFESNRRHYFDFTFWAMPVSHWAGFVPVYLELADRFRSQSGFRQSLISEVYFMRRDGHSLLSPTATEDAFTMDLADHRPTDPVWVELNKQFNALAAEFGGRPLLNQTKHLTGELVHRTLGDEWKSFAASREAQDVDGRFLSDYFRALI